MSNEFDAYQKGAATTAIYKDPIYPVLALGEEAGEVLGKFAKAVRKGVEFPKDDIIKELGDVLWNVAMIAHDLGVPLSVVARLNLLKLQDRRNRSVLEGSGDDR